MALTLPVSELESGARRSAVIARLSKLPPFHPAAVKLLAISASADSEVGDFERAFGSDPVLASDLLQVANSPLFGFRSRVHNLRHAIALLGLDAVSSLAVTIAMGSYVRSGKSRHAVQTVWAHSLATAIISQAIGRVLGEPGLSLYTAGLVHDIGRLGMLNLEGDQYAEVLARGYYEMEEALLLETLLFGLTHDDAGAFLARSWGFPETICECVRFHHQAAAAEQGQTTRVVQLACQYATALDLGELNCANRPAEAAEVLPPALRGVAQLEPTALQKQIEETAREYTGIFTGSGAGARVEAPRRQPIPIRKYG